MSKPTRIALCSEVARELEFTEQCAYDASLATMASSLLRLLCG